MIVYKGISKVDIDLANKTRYYLLFGEDGDKEGLNDFIEIKKIKIKEASELDDIINEILAKYNTSNEDKIREIDNRISILQEEIRRGQEEVDKLLRQKQELEEVRK